MSIERLLLIGLCVAAVVIFFMIVHLICKISEMVRCINSINSNMGLMERNLDFTSNGIIRSFDRMEQKWFNVSRNMNEIKDCVDGIEECLSAITDALEEEEEEDLDIHMITREEFYCERGEYMHQHLVYNEEKEIVHLEGNEDIVFEEYPALIGDGLRFFGVHGKEPHIIYIRNEKFKCDFEVTRIYAKKV